MENNEETDVIETDEYIPTGNLESIYQEIEDIPSRHIKTSKPPKRLNKTQLIDLSIFQRAAYMSLGEIVDEIGRTRYYSNKDTAVADASRRLKRVITDPEKYGVDPEDAHKVRVIVSKRSTIAAKVERREEIIKEVIDKENISMDQLILSSRHSAWILLKEKIEEALQSKDKRSKISLMEAAKVAGILFDKGQLLDGKATEHVAIMSNIDDKQLTASEAMQAIIKLREVNEQQSDERK